jgi:hypothetical protein
MPSRTLLLLSHALEEGVAENDLSGLSVQISNPCIEGNWIGATRATFPRSYRMCYRFS